MTNDKADNAPERIYKADGYLYSEIEVSGSENIIYILESSADKREQVLRDRIKELEKLYRHFFVVSKVDGFCDKCDLYLTDDIHIRAEGV